MNSTERPGDGGWPSPVTGAAKYCTLTDIQLLLIIISLLRRANLPHPERNRVLKIVHLLDIAIEKLRRVRGAARHPPIELPGRWSPRVFEDLADSLRRIRWPHDQHGPPHAALMLTDLARWSRERQADTLFKKYRGGW
jgi:hypothetical protein